MKILKWIGIGLLVILVILIIAGLVGKTIVEGKVRTMAEKQGTEMLKVPVKIGAIVIHPLAGQVAVKGVKIGNPAGFSKENAFELSSFSIGISYPALLKKQYVVTGVGIKKPVINVEILKNKNINLMAIMKNLPKQKKPKKKAKPLPEFLVKKIDLANGQVKVTDAGFASGTAKISLDDINFRLTDLTNMTSPPKDAGQFKLTAKLNNKSPLDVSGKIDSFMDKISFTVAALLKNIILTDFAPYYAKSPVNINRGSASIKLDLPCRREILNGKGRVTARDLDLRSKNNLAGQASGSVTELIVDEKGQLTFEFPITGTLKKPNIGLMNVFSDLMGRALAKGAQKIVESEVSKAIQREVTKGIRLGF